jgi:uncharacterized protein (DUF488 family)
MSAELFTIGHSNQPLERLLALLMQHGIKLLVDIRRFPSSKKFPHFNQNNLKTALTEAGIDYIWLEELGGRRRGPAAERSLNIGLQNQGFRNYADYMLTAEFRQGIDKLLAIAACHRAAIMCAEALFWRCHRRLVSDYLVANGVPVHHIMPTGELQLHKLTTGAAVEGGIVTYPGQKHLFA